MYGGGGLVCGPRSRWLGARVQHRSARTGRHTPRGLAGAGRGRLLRTDAVAVAGRHPKGQARARGAAVRRAVPRVAHALPIAGGAVAARAVAAAGVVVLDAGALPRAVLRAGDGRGRHHDPRAMQCRAACPPPSRRQRSAQVDNTLDFRSFLLNCTESISMSSHNLQHRVPRKAMYPDTIDLLIGWDADKTEG